MGGVAETLILGLVAYRVWRLLAVDTILAAPRAGLPLRIQHFLACPWCSGFWVTFIVGLIAHSLFAASLWLLIPAASVVVGLLGERD